MTTDSDLTPILGNFLVRVNLLIAVVISLEQKVVGELTKNLVKIQELVDNFFKVQSTSWRWWCTIFSFFETTQIFKPVPSYSLLFEQE